MNQARILYIIDMRDCEAASRMIGKTVLCSNSLTDISTEHGIIGKFEGINDRNCSFVVRDADGKTYYRRFIKEVTK